MEEEGVIDTKRKLVFFKPQQQPEKTENVPKIDVCVVAIFFRLRGTTYLPPLFLATILRRGVCFKITKLMYVVARKRVDLETQIEIPFFFENCRKIDI